MRFYFHCRDELETLDIDKPESSNPVNMPSSLTRQGNVPVSEPRLKELLTTTCLP